MRPVNSDVRRVEAARVINLGPFEGELLVRKTVSVYGLAMTDGNALHWFD